jgi:hypothetical protein
MPFSLLVVSVGSNHDFTGGLRSQQHAAGCRLGWIVDPCSGRWERW